MMFYQILCKKYGNDINNNIQLNDVFWLYKGRIDSGETIGIVNNSR